VPAQWYNLPLSLPLQCTEGNGKGKGKGKVHPIKGHEGPKGKWRYSSTLPLTSALDGGGWPAPHPGRFPPGKDPVPIV